MNTDKLRELLANLPLPLVANDERELWHGIGPGGRIATFDFDGVAARIEYAVNALPELLDELDRLRVDANELSCLLDEVRGCFTRDDDLPDNLLPRIDTAIAAQEGM